MRWDKSSVKFHITPISKFRHYWNKFKTLFEPKNEYPYPTIPRSHDRIHGELSIAHAQKANADMDKSCGKFTKHTQ